MNDSRQALAEMLEKIGYKLMSAHVKKETNKEVLKGYANLLQIEAHKREDHELLQRLLSYGLIN